VTRRDDPPPPNDATALIERPSFDSDSSSDGGEDVPAGAVRAGRRGRAASPFEGPSEEQPRVDDTGFDEETELTHPGSGAHAALRGARTQRIDVGALSSLDDLEDLPSARVSELQVSDLDGDVEAAGAPTAIMQLPPEMLAHGGGASRDDDDASDDDASDDDASDDDASDDDASDDVVAHDDAADDVAFRRWRAGPVPTAAATTTIEVPVPPAPPPALGPASAAHAGAPPAPQGFADHDADRTQLVALVDETTAAVTAAQIALDDLDVPTNAAQNQLLRALGALERLRDSLYSGGPLR
jgi:hypothetical protein